MNLDLNKKYLITGGSGFLGRGLISRLEKDNIKILQLSQEMKVS